ARHRAALPAPVHCDREGSGSGDQGVAQDSGKDRLGRACAGEIVRRAIALAYLAAAAATAQTGVVPPNPAAQAARAWRQAHENAVLSEFMTFLALPNLARDNQGIRKNAAAVSAMFEKRGVKTQYLEVPGAPPVVYGEIPAANAQRTIIFYAHYDGQPLDPKEWATPPWEPVLRGDRIYARSASDDKA